jgi:hypothetical protein
MADYDPRLSMTAYARAYDLYPEAIDADIASFAMDVHQDSMVAALERGDELEAKRLLVEQIPLLNDTLTHVRSLAIRTESVDRVARCDRLTGELQQLLEQINRPGG